MCVDRELINYLPPVLREVAEFKAINRANEPELLLAWEALEQVLGDQFLDSAGPQGVALWEQELRIRPKDTDTLELRKARVKALWNMETPYTLPWLQKWLGDACGAEAIVEGYRLLVRARAEALGILPDVKALVSQAAPANLLCMYLVYYEAAARARMAFASRRVDFHAGSSIFGIQSRRLDGMYALDGSWPLATEWARGAKFPGFSLSTGVGAGAALSGALTADSMWVLGGEYRLDGARRLNAAVVTTEL